MPIAPVVIVHHEGDGDVPARLDARVRAAGYETWRSGRDVLVGDHLHSAVSAQMSRNGPVVLCLGKETVSDGTARIVAMAALKRSLEDSRRYLLPVRVGPADAYYILQSLGDPEVPDCAGARFEEGIRALLATLARIHPLPAGDGVCSTSPQPASIEEQIDAYLKSAREEHRLLPVAGFETEVKIPITLNEVYVSLRARVHRVLTDDRYRWGPYLEPNTGEAMAALVASGLTDAPVTGLACESAGGEALEERSVRLEEAFQLARDRFKLRGIVVVGDPGSGKTTLLKRLLIQCIDRGSEALGLPPGLVPILLPLRYLRDPSRGIDAFIQEQLETNPHLKLSPGFGGALLARGRLLLLLDGLDEVADDSARIEVRRWIEQAHTARPDCWFAVTSRFAGYQGKARFDGRFLELDMQPFDDDQARAFIRQWYTAVEVGLRGEGQHARAQAEQQTARIWSGLTMEELRSRRLRSLIGNPLLLTILCLVHRVRGNLPTKRVLLYRECVNVLLEHWQKAKDLELPFHVDQARQALQPVAWWLHQVEGRTRADARELAPVLEAPLRGMRLAPEAALPFLAAIRDRSGLLVGWDVDSFGFMHLSFQEYLAALHIRQEALSDNPAILDDVVSRFGDSWWKEVLLLLVGLPDIPMFERVMRRVVRSGRFVEQGEVVSLCIEEASQVSARPFLEVLEADDGASTAVQYAALQALKPLQDPGIEEACRRLQHSPYDVVRSLARELLVARGVMPAPPALKRGDVWVHRATGLEFVYVPAGRFDMGGREDCGGVPIHTVTFARGFWIGKYPVTNAQYGRCLEATKCGEPRFWQDSQWNAPDQPVVGLTWSDAMAYCRWATAQLEDDLPPDGAYAVLLPSEAEWEYAARGPEARVYPWGAEAPAVDRANLSPDGNGVGGIGRTTPVGRYPDGTSWVGALDMAGNVWEWCVDVWHGSYWSAPEDGSPWVEGGVGETRVVRGGCWYNGAAWLQSAFRVWWRSDSADRLLGFRVVLAAPGARDLDD